MFRLSICMRVLAHLSAIGIFEFSMYIGCNGCKNVINASDVSFILSRFGDRRVVRWLSKLIVKVYVCGVGDPVRSFVRSNCAGAK